MEIIIFDTTKELYKFLKDSGGLDILYLFRDTPQKSIPADNIGYVAINSKLEVLGAASLYEEEPGVWFNELFEIAKEYQGKGIGRQIIQTLEKDEFFLRAKRIEIPASITAVEFYRKMGYDYKNGNNKIDEEHLYRLEKFR